MGLCVKSRLDPDGERRELKKSFCTEVFIPPPPLRMLMLPPPRGVCCPWEW